MLAATRRPLFKIVLAVWAGCVGVFVCFVLILPVRHHCLTGAVCCVPCLSPCCGLYVCFMQDYKVGRTVKLVNDAPHRWLTSVNFLEVILSVWPVLRIHHRKKENTTFPPTGSEESIPQLFALVYPVSDAIKDSQGLLTWTAGKTVLNIAELLVGVLNPAASLTVSRGVLFSACTRRLSLVMFAPALNSLPFRGYMYSHPNIA